MPINRNKPAKPPEEPKPKRRTKPAATDETEEEQELGESSDSTALNENSSQSGLRQDAQESQLSLQEEESQNGQETSDEEKSKLLDEVESVFGTGLESDEPKAEAENEDTPSPFLNCSEFKVGKITKEAKRLFSFKFTADSVKGESEWNQMPSDPAQTPFEKVFEDIGKLIAPKVFPGLPDPDLVSITRNTKQVKKQPVTFFVFEVASYTGLAGSISKSAKIPASDLGDDFKQMFNEMENKLHEEMRGRRNVVKQTTLDFEEGDEDEED